MKNAMMPSVSPMTSFVFNIVLSFVFVVVVVCETIVYMHKPCQKTKSFVYIDLAF